MNSLLCATLLLLVGFSAITSANPIFKESKLGNGDYGVEHTRSKRGDDYPTATIDPEKFRLERFEGGSGRDGTDFFAQARARVWQSQNGNNDLHITGNYGQHFGGPYGNSPPSYGGGLTFTHRF